MGMFDELLPKKQNWKCFNCKKPLALSDGKQYFQTKELGEGMRVFEEGKAIRLQTGEINCSLGNGYIFVYDWCEECEKMNYFIATIRKGIWSKTKQVKEEMG